MGTTSGMLPSRREAGFTLIELLVVVGIIAVIVGTLGVFFLGGPSPAVASASRDIDAVFDEARATAIALGEATVVFAPAGSGYSARVYRQVPGDAAFQAVNGPTYDSSVVITETAAPLGAPGFAFRIDSRGSVTGYASFRASDTTYTERSCPATGAFMLLLAYEKQERTVAIPCTRSLSSTAVTSATTPAPATTTTPYAPGTCPAQPSCSASLPPFTATCPPGYTTDALPNVCDSPTPVPTPTPTPTPTCPPGSDGTYPFCKPGPAPTLVITPPSTPDPTAPPTSGSAPSPWSVSATSGSHATLSGGQVAWLSWASVDLYLSGSHFAQVCFGTFVGQSRSSPPKPYGMVTSDSLLESQGVPQAIIDQLDSACD